MTQTPRRDLLDTHIGAVSGGVIESVKKAFVLALRTAVFDTSIVDSFSKVQSVDMEYPLVPEKYPGVWVQFSLTDLVTAGIAHELMSKDDSDPDWTNWEPIREWLFTGSVTLSVLALTSLERDRISDSLISMLAFSRSPSGVITHPAKDTRQYRALLTSLYENPYVSASINSDRLKLGGQATEVGSPWSPDVLVYTDSYSFDVQGAFDIIFKNDGTYTLRRTKSVPERWDPTDWH